MEYPSLTIFIGEKEKAVHEVLCTTYHGHRTHVYVSFKDDKPVFTGEIERVHIEATGNIDLKEIITILEEFSEFGGRTGQASEFCLQQLQATPWDPQKLPEVKFLEKLLDNLPPVDE